MCGKALPFRESYFLVQRGCASHQGLSPEIYDRYSLKIIDLPHIRRQSRIQELLLTLYRQRDSDFVNFIAAFGFGACCLYDLQAI